MSSRTISFLAALLLAAPSLSAEVRDGKLFDPGVTRTEPAPGAPEALSRLAPFVGAWDIELEVFRGEESLRSTGIASVTYMNRGHGLMERTRIADFDGEGHPMATLTFFAVGADGVWTASEGNSWTESISVASGGFEDDGRLVLHDALRPGGGPQVLLLRQSYGAKGEDGFEMTLETSSDLGRSWRPAARRLYQRRTSEPGFFPVRDDVGLPAPERPEEAAEFDFLLGEFDATHWLRGPQGETRWKSNETAVYSLDGHAILEFDGHDQDPSLPDAATSILRLYNRSMRRWESLFLTNRGNRPLHFGGVREGERIVLHPFGAQTGSTPVRRWIFFDVRKDAYRWKGLVSNDRGKSFSASWSIHFARQGVAPDEAMNGRATEVAATTSDGVRIFGDHYRPAAPGSPTVVLFHQAEGDARGEYGGIARRLWKEGFEVFAWDARGGGDRFGSPNRTLAALGGPPPEGYCVAYRDLEAALGYVFDQGSGGPIYAVGSSYSAALVIRLAAEHGNRLAGVAPFSPAPALMDACEVKDWLPRVDGVPIVVFRPEREMKNDRVAVQTRLLRERGIEIFTAPRSAHGASMLNPERSVGDVEPTWQRLLKFLGAS